VIRHLLAPHVPAAANSLGVPRGFDSDGVVMTFDDGPHPEGTPAVLDLLARAGARAMFFVVGEQVERRPELVRDIAAGGHVVALHGYRHRFQPRLGAVSVAQDVRRGRAVVEDALGGPVSWHRPPYGVYSPAGLEAVRDLGLRPLLWSRWGKDWRKFTSAQRIARRAGRELTDGDVILLHDADFYSARNSHRRTVQALGLILADLRAHQIGTVLPV